MDYERRLEKKMIFFITVLRALAACLITNAHYTGIYPIEIIANGGLIGDVLFFAVSGYCLYNVKYELSPKGFALWYGKRLWRVYPPVILMTLIYMLVGYYSLKEQNVFWWYVYPTYYHFVASIIILYIPFFFTMKIEKVKRHITAVMFLVALVGLGVYIFWYDKTSYHIDTVREPYIRFLFFESMLLGAWFRKNDYRFRNIFQWRLVGGGAISFAIYFVSKILFSGGHLDPVFQIVNQVAIFVLLYYLFRLFAAIDWNLTHSPGWVKKLIEFVSGLTLEIYVVQYVLIEIIRNLGLPFPLNWIVLTAAIVLFAFALKSVCDLINKTIDRLLEKIAKREHV